MQDVSARCLCKSVRSLQRDPIGKLVQDLCNEDLLCKMSIREYMCIILLAVTAVTSMKR